MTKFNYPPPPEYRFLKSTTPDIGELTINELGNLPEEPFLFLDQIEKEKIKAGKTTIVSKKEGKKNRQYQILGTLTTGSKIEIIIFPLSRKKEKISLRSKVK